MRALPYGVDEKDARGSHFETPRMISSPLGGLDELVVDGDESAWIECISRSSPG